MQPYMTSIVLGMPICGLSVIRHINPSVMQPYMQPIDLGMPICVHDSGCLLWVVSACCGAI